MIDSAGAPRHDARVLNVYVAGGSIEVARVAAFIERLKASGLVRITYDWTPDVIANGSSVTSAVRNEATARAELAGVLTADLVVMLTPERGSTGAGFELGHADAAGRRIVCVGPHLPRFFFGVLFEEVASEDEALALVLDAAVSRAAHVRFAQLLDEEDGD